MDKHIKTFEESGITLTPLYTDAPQWCPSCGYRWKERRNARYIAYLVERGRDPWKHVFCPKCGDEQ